MRTLHRHLLQEMIASIGVAVMVCTGLLLLGNLLKEILALLMTGQATLWLVVRGIGLLIPFVLTFALPMGALTAALLVFGRLSADQELTAARANGISLMALALPVVLLSLGLCGLCGWINLELAPRCRVAYKDLFREIAREHARTLIPPGRFVTEYPGFVIYADRVQGDDLEDVLFFQIKDGMRVRDVRAPRARLAFVEERRELSLTFFNARILEWVPRRPAPPPAAIPTPEAAPPTEETALPSDGEPAPDPEGSGDAVEPGSPDASVVAGAAASVAEEASMAGVVAADEGPGEGPDDVEVGAPGVVPVAEGVSAVAQTEGTVSAAAEPGGAPGKASEAAPLTADTGAVEPAVVAGDAVAAAEPVVGGAAVPAEEGGWWLSITSGDAQASVTLPAEMVREGMPQLKHMTWRQLWAERRELQRLGLEDLTPLEVQLHRQAAFSFATFGFVLIGIPLGVRAHRRETSVGVAVAIGLVLIYYAFLVVAQAFETQVEAAPWIIVWMPNALFQLAGGWLLWRVNRGR